MQKKILPLIVGGLLVQLPLFAMDMAKVNKLAEEIKAQIHGSKHTNTPTPQEQTEASPAAAVSVAETMAAATSSGGTISEESLSYRNTNLYSEDQTVPPPVSYTKAAPGTAKTFQRSFENAPPMIPHSVEGLLPITKSNNACLGCHMPDVAPSMKATPIPPSHFANFRPHTKIGAGGEVIKEGKAVANTSDIQVVVKKQNKLYQGRFNCSQCHAPQAEVTPIVKNKFTPDFKSENAAKRSNLLDTLNEGVEVQ